MRPSYAGLHQLWRGNARAHQSASHVPLGLSAATPIDSLVRVESLSTPLPDHIVLTDNAGAAVVLWPGKVGLTLNADEHPESATGRGHGHDKPGCRKAPALITADSAPLLVHGLPSRNALCRLPFGSRIGAIALRGGPTRCVPVRNRQSTAFSLNGVIGRAPTTSLGRAGRPSQVAPRTLANRSTCSRCCGALARRQSPRHPKQHRHPRRGGAHAELGDRDPAEAAGMRFFQAPRSTVLLCAMLMPRHHGRILVTSSGGDLACLDARARTRWR